MSAGTDASKRVIWRLQEKYPNTDVFTLKQVRRAIMFECGVCERTIINKIKLMKELGWMKRGNRYTFKLTGNHQN